MIITSIIIPRTLLYQPKMAREKGKAEEKREKKMWDKLSLARLGPIYEAHALQSLVQLNSMPSQTLFLSTFNFQAWSAFIYLLLLLLFNFETIAVTCRVAWHLQAQENIAWRIGITCMSTWRVVSQNLWVLLKIKIKSSIFRKLLSAS